MGNHKLCFYLLIPVCTGMLLAQETISHASISGRVFDDSGAVIPDAAVTALELSTNRVTTVTTDREGRYRFPYLSIGPCEIGVRHGGFTEAVRTVRLAMGAALDLPVTLSVLAAETQVVVSAESPVLETARTQIAGTVSEFELQRLPLNGRNILDIALLIPGVSPTNTGSTQVFAETSAIPGQGLSVNSQRNFSNSFIVDGLSANDDAAGLAGTVFGASTVSEFQVVTSGGQAEFGRALGGYISVVTKSGANQVHGDLYGYFGNQRLNAGNPLSHAKLPVTDTQFGADLGGPIARDRSFFFGNFEQRRLNQSGLTTIDPAAVAVVNDSLRRSGYGGQPLSTGVYPNPVHSTTGLAKVDHQLSPGDHVSVRYNVYSVLGQNSRGAGGLSAPSSSADLRNTDQTLAGSNIATLSSRLVMETRGQVSRGDLAAPPSDPVGPAVSIAGVASFGTLSGSPTARVNSMYELVHNVSYQHGSHAFRAGIDLLHNTTTITYPRAVRGSYSFSSLTNFLRGVYNNSGFTQTFGPSAVHLSNPNLGVFVQDEWRPASRLTLNIGARYDVQGLETIATDTNNIAPRVGFAWSPFASRRSVVRGSYGLFYDRVPLRALANALLSAGNTNDPANLRQLSVSLSPTQTGAPIFPNILLAPAIPAGVLFNFSTMDRRMQNAYAAQANVEFEHQLGAHTTLSAGYQRVRGIHLIASVNQNVPVCAPSGTNNACRPDPRYANDARYSAAADSFYDGLHVSFVQRPVRGLSSRISYTWSKAEDNVGEFFFSSPMNNLNIWDDYGRSDDDQRHRLVFNGSYQSSVAPAHTLWQHITRDFTAGVMVQYYSALPFNITSGVNTIQGTAARPLVNGAYIPRNSGTGFDFFNVNARTSRNFRFSERVRMELIAEAFNALNHTNGVSLNGVFGPGAFPANPLPQFRQTTAVASPRTLRFALQLSF